MSRPRKPTALKKLEGNPGNRPLPENELRPLDLPLKPPKIMSVGAVAAWKRIIPTMPAGLFLACDQTVLMVLCENVARFEKATAMLARESEVSVGSQGQPVVSPWVRIQNEAAEKILKCCTKLGLDPVARTHLTMSEEDEDDGWIAH